MTSLLVKLQALLYASCDKMKVTGCVGSGLATYIDHHISHQDSCYHLKQDSCL